MGVTTYAENTTSVRFAEQLCETAVKIEDEHSGETRGSTNSPESGPADESQLMMDEMALMGPPTLDRLTTDEQYGPFGVPANAQYGMMAQGRPNGMPLESMMPPAQEDVIVPVEMSNNLP